MKINIDNFECHHDELHDLTIVPINNDVGGGEITKDEIDIIKEYPDAKSLKISGLNQETFEYLIDNYGTQFEAITFFKNKLVSDLSMLGTLSQLKYVYYFFNQRVTKLWDMSNNTNLIGLAIDDFSKLRTIDEVASAPNLKKFEIGNAIWSKTTIESIKPLMNSTITHFAWWGEKVEDNDFLCLADSKVCELDLNISRFKMEDLAKLVANIPNLRGKATKPYRESSIVDVDGTKTTYYFLCKGKKALIKGEDDAKLEKYLSDFEQIVAQYRRDNCD